MKHSSPRAGGFRTRAKLFLWLLLASWSASVVPGHAAPFRNWTGDASGFWSNPNNWDPVGVPQNGEFLSFFADENRSMVNDLTGLVVDGLRFDFHDYSLAGNPLTVGGPAAPGFPGDGLIEARGFDPLTVTINCALILGDDTTFDSGNTGVSARLRLNADINLNGHTMTMSVASGGRIEVAGSISGTGNV